MSNIIADEEYTVLKVPVDVVFSDDNFNCRGVIASFEVTDLAQDIAKNGLQFPIAIQPACDVENQLPTGKEYRIVAGHRRFKAWSVLRSGWLVDHPGEPNPYDTIPAMVRTGLTELAARVLNLGENLKRQNLDILQEAKAIEHLYEMGMPRDHVAAELGMSSGWVQTRYYLLALPEDIQQEVKAGFINQLQIKQLYSLRDDPEKIYETVKDIKKKKMKGEKVGHVGKRKKASLDTKKERKRVEIFEMNQLLAKSCGYGLHTRVLGWASGEVTTEEIFEEIRLYCSTHNKPEPDLPREL